jgi:hypothetical protein
MMRFWGVVLWVTLVVFVGCAHSTRTCKIAVNSFANPYAETTLAYLVLPLNEGVQPNDLEFQEYSRYLGKALDARGYRAARSFEEAQVAVFLGYGIGPPEKHVANYHAPVAGPIPAGSTVAIPMGTSDLADTASTDVHTKFTRYAIINAIDFAEYKAERRLVRVWSTKIVSIGNTGDLRAMFPVILAGAWDLLGVNRRRVIYRQVELNGEQVLWMKSASRARGGSASEPAVRVGAPN